MTESEPRKAQLLPDKLVAHENDRSRKGQTMGLVHMHESWHSVHGLRDELPNMNEVPGASASIRP